MQFAIDDLIDLVAAQVAAPKPELLARASARPSPDGLGIIGVRYLRIVDFDDPFGASDALLAECSRALPTDDSTCFEGLVSRAADR